MTVGNAAILGPHRYKEIRETVHWDLGLERWKEFAENDHFWDSVQEAIENAPISYRNPDLLLLLGDAAYDKISKQR